MSSKKRLLFSFIALAAITVLTVSCSDSKKPTEKTNSNAGNIGIITPKKNTNIKFDDTSLEKLPKSEAGASTFAYKVAGIFVSTDVTQRDVFEKVLSSQNTGFSVDAALQRNASSTLSRITFSPMGIAMDKFAGDNATIAVVGLSFESGSDKVISQWKEIRMELSYEKGWKVSDFVIGSLLGPAGDGSKLTPEFLASWSGYYFPANEISSGQKTILDQLEQNFGTVDENGAPVTFPPGE